MDTDEFTEDQFSDEQLREAEECLSRAMQEAGKTASAEATARVTAVFRAFLAQYPAARSITAHAWHMEYVGACGADRQAERWTATLDFLADGLVYTYAETDGTITREGRGRDIDETPALRCMLDAFVDMVDGSAASAGDVWLAAGGEGELFTVSREGA